MPLPPDHSSVSPVPTPLDRKGELLERYLLARGDEEMDETLRLFGREHASLIETARALRTSWQSDLAPRDGPAGMGRTAEAIRQLRIPSVSAPAARSRWMHARYRRIAGWSVATVALIGLVALGTVHRRGTSSSANDTFRRITTTTGQVAVIHLDDGTRVTLAPRSELRIPATEGRPIALVGEAHFAVVSATKAPFMVQSGAVTARVLGTAFTMRRYGTDTKTLIAVSQGKVAVTVKSAQRPSATLTAGIVGTATDSEIVATSLADGMQYDGWMKGYLIFRKAPVPEVLAALARWYGYEFRLADTALATKDLNVALSTKSSKAAFTTLKTVLDVDLAFDGNIVTLRPHSAGARTPTRLDSHDVTSSPKEMGR